MRDQSASPVIHEGHVYFIGGGRARCVVLASGKVKWEKRLSGNATLSSPVLADGKLFAVAAPRLYVIKADPEKYQLLGKVKLGLAKWTSPAIADGRHVRARSRRKRPAAGGRNLALDSPRDPT